VPAATLLIYFGLLAAFLGGVSLIRPLKFVRIHSRGRAALVSGLGAVVALAGFVLPIEEHRIATPRTQLDQFASPLFRTLTWIRRGGRHSPESILNPTENVPLLEVATKTAFLVLAEEPGREIVLGTAVMVPAEFRATKRLVPEDFRAVQQPGFAIAMMNFVVEDDGAEVCLVSTETRIRATDPSARRRFAAYWRMIYPGSALIRRMWLRAIKKRAEGSAP
jgi:hypothetical protein